MSLVSVIIPIYNHAEALAQSMRTLFVQTHRPLEIIAINDGSTDNVEPVIKKIHDYCHSDRVPKGRVEESLDVYAATRDSSVATLPQNDKQQIAFKYITQTNQGAPAARNRGFAESVGDFVIFWDADTIARPDMLEKMLLALTNNPQASYAYSDFQFGWKKFTGREFNADELRKNNFIDVTSLIRRADFCGFDTTIKRFQDWDLWLTLLKKNKTGVYVPEMLYQKLVGKRKGISGWLPRIAFNLPWKSASVRRYETAKKIVETKHGLK
ncbi:MAG: glycosyltransferase family A protein [Patescibacteria group bacterium]